MKPNVVNIRMTDERKRKLQLLAEDDNRTMTQWVENLIDREFAKMKRRMSDEK